MTDALDRLKNRSRPRVQQRDASLTPSYPDISTARPNAQTGPATAISRHIESPIPEQPDTPLVVKRSTFRMEETLTERLHALCRQHGLSREVFIEAMFEYVEADDQALAQVLVEADSKNEYRQQLANRKRAEAMMRKFGG